MAAALYDLPELDEVRQLVDLARGHLVQRVACEVEAAGKRLPVVVLTMGSEDQRLPAVGYFGGVHGLERIGAEVVMAHLRSLVMRLTWDAMLHRMLASMRLVFMPLVNPGGLRCGTRANPQGVDLMRNAPVDSAERVPFLVGGQRLSAALPWYRGPRGAPMQAESAALCQVVQDELLSRPFSIAIDCHSGFGVLDRLWFPYAHTRRPIAHLAEVHALYEIFEQAHPQHRYVFEPQSRQYLAHGDLWDHLYRQTCTDAATAVAPSARTFLPLTLEMGSWLWVKKNPRQIFSRRGIFNPQIAHRQQRVLRRHALWLDFVARAACSHQCWLPAGAARQHHHQAALSRWYASAAP